MFLLLLLLLLMMMKEIRALFNDAVKCQDCVASVEDERMNV